MVTAQHFKSCLNLARVLDQVGLEHDWDIGWNESLVTRARNEMAKKFLDSKFERLFWLDADIEFTPDDIADVYNLDADIGIAFYSMKRPDKPLSAWKDGRLVNIDDCPKEPFEVEFAGTGFMCIKRNVLEKLAETSESYIGPLGRTPALFMTPIHNDGFESEDYNFCRRAREIGFKVIGNPAIRLGHYGQFRYGA